jgi:dihydropteroate synthase
MSSYTMMRGLRQKISDVVQAAKYQAAAEARLSDFNAGSVRPGSDDADEDARLQRAYEAERTLIATSVSVEKAKVAVASSALEAYVEGVVTFIEVDA